ncbi:protein SSUH2 homolog [Mantella aurantiaca]
MFEPPPPYTEPCVPTAPPPEIRMPPPYISEDVARQVLLDYSKKHSFFSSKVAAEVAFEKSQTFHTHRYRLMTFTESRKCKWVTVPYDGGSVNGPGDRPIPKPWDIPVQVPTMFQDGTQKVKVPESRRLQGRKVHSRQRHMCKGQGSLLKYVELTVKWKNNTFEFVADNKSDFPSKSFKKVTGEIVLSDEQMSLFPVTGFPDPFINEVSQNAIRQHRAKSKHFKILKQKHSIEWLPLTKVEYTWKNKKYTFFVYGKENKVHAEEYPMGASCAVM